MIQFVAGDLFANKYGVTAIAHGVNTKAIWGAGISYPFFKNWPDMADAYCELCKKKGSKLLGKGLYWDDRENSGLFVCNLFTQEFPGPDAKYEHIENALINCKGKLDKESIDSLGLPLIGGGIGGLDEEKIKDIIRLTFQTWHGKVVFYEKYVKGC